jgi:hypothetical protein
MKFFKWKDFLVTGLVCLLPILLGLSLWEKLPDVMAIHFNVYGEADNYASKAFVVFGLPVIMVLVQWFNCFVNDINSYKHGAKIKLETVTKWIIPILTVVLQIITLCYSLGWNIDIRKAVSFIVGIIFVLIGNYLPKFDYVKNYNLETHKARKINRFIGYETVIMGILFFISILLPPVSTVVCLVLLVPYSLTAIFYSIKTARK